MKVNLTNISRIFRLTSVNFYIIINNCDKAWMDVLQY